ncbi:hypothetical protein Micbo1qcDRAFT_127656 [Microdochium bolleyi]|uniref:NB-ARC domain-containing protein n=1 Tax=Microdochium bolleyi TaxID=196109 RepID=A0A136IL17_9PEZI|nr:hypothetical protein Micbo1qcDRAFT_127656 [Microdochium bolleyi]
MLPHAVPTARIMVFNYRSNWLGESALRQSIGSAAGGLLQALVEEREDCADRPLLLIGHCFGGLIIQRVYNEAMKTKADYPGLAAAIIGTIFLATPFQGLESQAGFHPQGQVYAMIVAADVEMQDNVFQSISRDNDTLIDTVTTFTRHLELEERRPMVFCFFEQKPSPVGRVIGATGLPKQFMVGQQASTLGNYQYAGLMVNHFEMNCFKSAQDGHYKSVRRQIVKIYKARDLTSRPSRRPSTPSDEKYSIPSLGAPIAKEPDFAQRGDILDSINDNFEKTRTVVLLGECGSGKTHVAVEYAHKFHQENPGSAVHWVGANSAEHFAFSCRRIAKTLHLKLPKGDPILPGVKAAFDALKEEAGNVWLLVLDGLDNPSKLMITLEDGTSVSLLELPKTSLSRILVTTRDKKYAMKATKNREEYIHRLSSLDNKDAAQILLGAKSADRHIQNKYISEVIEAFKGSAGAIALAKVYVSRKSPQPRDLARLVTTPVPGGDTKTNRFTNLWQQVIALLSETGMSSQRLLKLLGVINVQSVSAVFFTRDEFRRDIPILVDHGLIEPSADRRVFSMSAFVRSCARHWLDQDSDLELAEEVALATVSDRFDENDVDRCELLLPLVMACFEVKSVSVEAVMNVTVLHYKLGEYFAKVGDLISARVHTQAALKLAHAASNRSLASAATSVARDGVNQAQEFLETLRKDTGHPVQDKTVREASQMATNLLQRGELSASGEVEGILRKILQLSDKKNATDPMETARHTYNLAMACEDQGNYVEAERLLTSAANMVKAQGSPSTPFLLNIRGSLAGVHCRQGRFQAAREALIAVLNGQRSTLGHDHADTLVTRQNLAMVLECEGDVDAAHKELILILQAHVRTSGVESPEVLRALCSLAANMALRGERKDARAILIAAHKGQLDRLGPNHRDTVATTRMLAEHDGSL